MEKWGFPMGGLRSMAETLAAFEVPSSVPGPQAVPSRRRGSLHSSPSDDWKDLLCYSSG